MAVLGLTAVWAAVSLLAGCGSTSTVSTIPTASLPAVPAATPTNTYTGTQSPGLWSFTLDDTQNAFSYQATTYPATPNVPTTGTAAPLNGLFRLTSGASTAAGYAVERQSRAFLLRPGDDTADLVAGVKMDSCFALGGQVTFNFVYLPSAYDSSVGVQPLLPGASGDVAVPYGTIVASTSTDGSTWQFGNYTGGAASYGDPSSFSGTCAVTNGQAAVTVTENANNTMPATISVNQAGYIFIDHSVASWSKSSPPEPSQIGVIQPSSAISTSSVLAGNYAGFFSAPGDVLGTAPVYFTLTPGPCPNTTSTPVNGVCPTPCPGTFSGTSTTTCTVPCPVTAGVTAPCPGPTPVPVPSLTGGAYPNDDITQTPNTDTIINLGNQDSTNYGFYPSATVTRPDPTGKCVYYSGIGTVGVDVNGNATCTFASYAVVGNSDGKYAIFLVAGDPADLNSQGSNGAALGIYLFQQ
jgi:hypothetical protein